MSHAEKRNAKDTALGSPSGSVGNSEFPVKGLRRATIVWKNLTLPDGLRMRIFA